MPKVFYGKHIHGRLESFLPIMCIYIYKKSRKSQEDQGHMGEKGRNRSNRGGGVLVLSSAIQTVKHICTPGFSGGDFYLRLE